MADPFLRWLDTLNQRHCTSLNFQEVRRAVQALSALYVERRRRLVSGSTLESTGKRAAFATFYAPLHFLLVREIVRALNAGSVSVPEILDLGCGTGVAAAAWATEMKTPPRILAIDSNSWAVRETKATCAAFGLRAQVRQENLDRFKVTGSGAIVCAFTVNELSEEARDRMQRSLIAAARSGRPVLVIEPIARLPWWPQWAEQWTALGGRADEWRFALELPAPLALMDKAAGLDHRELTGRSLWVCRRGHTSCE